MAKGFMTRRSGNPPNPSYETNMISFFPMPGSSGKIRLRVKKPSDSDGVMIRQKSSAWASGDTKDTGTFIAMITDDTNYSGGNQWYEVSGLSDGTEYHFKAFPYKGASYNETIGNNETKCKAGGLYLELTMDSISGSTINDTSGNGRHKTLTGVTFESGKVGNTARGGNSRNINLGVLPLENKTICMWINYGTAYTVDTRALEIGDVNGAIAIVSDEAGSLHITKGTGYCKFNNAEAPYNQTNFVCTKNTVNVCKANVNNGAYKTFTGNAGQYPSANNVGYLLCSRVVGNFLTGTIDQFRIFDRELEDYEVTNIYNGGAGC